MRIRRRLSLVCACVCAYIRRLMITRRRVKLFFTVRISASGRCASTLRQSSRTYVRCSARRGRTAPALVITSRRSVLCLYILYTIHILYYILYRYIVNNNLIRLCASMTNYSVKRSGTAPVNYVIHGCSCRVRMYT